MILTRRSLFAGLGAVLAAPAIIRASSLMPVRSWVEPIRKVHITSANPAYLAGEPIWTGDVVSVRPDGRLYRWRKEHCADFQGVGVSAVTCSEGVPVRLVSFADDASPFKIQTTQAEFSA